MALTKVIGDGTGTIDNLTVADAGIIGSASKTNAITIASSGLVQLTSTGIGAGSQVFQVIDDGATLFQIRSEDGNVSFPQAGAGIFLGVTSGNSANLLDDYEEGTFTPAYNQNTGSTTAIGKYTKIGNMVIINIKFSGTQTSSTTALGKITGLPFTIHETCGNLTINTREFATTGKHLHANLNSNTTESFTFTDASNGATFGAGAGIGFGFTFAYAIQGS